MFNSEIFDELKPQYLEFVVQGKEEIHRVPRALKPCLVSSIGDKDFYDVPIAEVSKFKEEIDKILETRVYIALAFLHSGEGVYVMDESGVHLNSYSRGDNLIWVRKKFFIVCPKGDTAYITGWEFTPHEPYYQNILALYYKANFVPCNFSCFCPIRKDILV